MAKQALGKGLGALIKKTTVNRGAAPSSEKKPRSSAKTLAPPGEAGQEVRQVPLDLVVASPLQPRTHIPDSALEELHDSIRQHGVIQPLIVRRVGNKLELIAGERRLRACAKLGLATIPVIEREATDREVLEMALVENLQRQDLNPIEEAGGYVRLAREFEMKQDEIAKRVGKSRASVANSMRLLDLHKEIQDFVAHGQITVGHAKAILGLKVKRDQRDIAEEAIRRRLTVRAIEKLVQDRHAEEEPGKRPQRGPKDNDPETTAMIRALTARLREHFTTHASIVHSPRKGRLELEYYGNDDLERLLEMMGVSTEGL
jgi:ParB family chromosome partitioning protein